MVAGSNPVAPNPLANRPLDDCVEGLFCVVTRLASPADAFDKSAPDDRPSSVFSRHPQVMARVLVGVQERPHVSANLVATRPRPVHPPLPLGLGLRPRLPGSERFLFNRADVSSESHGMAPPPSPLPGATGHFARRTSVAG